MNNKLVCILSVALLAYVSPLILVWTLHLSPWWLVVYMFIGVRVDAAAINAAMKRNK